MASTGRPAAGRGGTRTSAPQAPHLAAPAAGAPHLLAQHQHCRHHPLHPGLPAPARRVASRPSGSRLPKKHALHLSTPQQHNHHQRRLHHHIFSPSTLFRLLRHSNVRTRLSLMFLLPGCYASAYWKTLSVGGVSWLVAKLVLPRLQIVFVWIRQSATSIITPPPSAASANSAASASVPQSLFNLNLQSPWLLACLFLEQQHQNIPPSLPSPPLSDHEPHDMADDHGSQPLTPIQESPLRPIPPITAHDILKSAGPNSPVRPLPAERIGAPLVSPSLETPSMSRPPSLRPTPSHTRTTSLADGSRSKRASLNLNFPVLPPSRPPSWHASPVVSPEIVASPTAENNGFLTVLASQERRVLELKEELKQAEQELDRLKKQWANQEIIKKRREARRTLALQPLNTSIPLPDAAEDDLDGSQQWLQRETDRRRAMIGGAKSSHMRVFSGSRHARTLSLLSPERHLPAEYRDTSPSPDKLFNRRSLDQPMSAGVLGRAATTSDIGSSAAGSKDDLFGSNGTPRDAFVRTSRQMATGIKDGLWTFFEDIRQATVGEEGISGVNSRLNQLSNGSRSPSKQSGTGPARRSTTSSTRPSTMQPRSAPPMDTLVDVGGTFWLEHGIEEPMTKVDSPRPVRSVPKPTIPTPHKPKSLEEGWDIWDSPAPILATAESSLSTIRPEPTSPSTQCSDSTDPTTNSSSPRSPEDGADAKSTPKPNPDAIPWPTLTKLSPGNLRRTASHLMDEWEKSIVAPQTPAHGKRSHT